LTITIVCNFLW